MLFPPVCAADMAASAKVEADGGVEGFQFLESSKEPDDSVATSSVISKAECEAFLFCLGLANSRGMRADRLPDLVNSGVLKAGKSSETKVTVKFDLTDWKPDEAEEGIEPTEDT